MNSVGRAAVIAVGLAAGSLLAVFAPAQAADLPSTDIYFEPRSLSEQPNPLVAPSREYTGVPVGSWLLYPKLFVGTAFDSNVFNSNSFRTSDVAWRIRPSFTAETDSGIHKTLVYGVADARLYHRHPSADVATARLGFAHVWEVQRDLIVRTQADYLRNQDVSNAGQIFTFSGLGTAVQPITYNTFTGQVTVQKSFGRFFTALGGAFSASLYENTRTVTGLPVSQSYRDSRTETVSGRVGYWVSPVFYAFVEPTGNFRQYFNSPAFNSNGLRVIGGVGTDRIGLFRGEFYAGYLAQYYDNPLFGTVTSPVVGGRLWYYPLQELTLYAQVDQTATEATFLTAANPLGSVARTTSGQATATYGLSQLWSASVRANVARSDFTNSARRDTIIGASGQLNYSIWRNFEATGEYVFTSVSSNFPGVGFTKHLVSTGVTYRY